MAPAAIPMIAPAIAPPAPLREPTAPPTAPPRAAPKFGIWAQAGLIADRDMAQHNAMPTARDEVFLKIVVISIAPFLRGSANPHRVKTFVRLTEFPEN